MPSRKAVVKLYVSEAEYGRIMESADRAGLSLSTFGKRVCLGYEVKSLIDQKAMLELVNIGGNFGHLGGLLKNSLKEGTLERGPKVNRLLDELSIDKKNIMKLVGEMRQNNSQTSS